MYFNPPVSFVGRKGFEKFIHDLPKWEYELTKEEYDKVLINMVMLFGSVPTVPNALRGINEPDSINYCGGFDKMSRILEELGNEYNNKNWLKASKRFAEGATAISEIKDVIVDYLMGNRTRL